MKWVSFKLKKHVSLVRCCPHPKLVSLDNRNIGRDQVSPQKKGGKADPVVKRRLSSGSKP